CGCDQRAVRLCCDARASVDACPVILLEQIACPTPSVLGVERSAPLGGTGRRNLGRLGRACQHRRSGKRRTAPSRSRLCRWIHCCDYCSCGPTRDRRRRFPDGTGCSDRRTLRAAGSREEGVRQAVSLVGQALTRRAMPAAGLVMVSLNKCQQNAVGLVGRQSSIDPIDEGLHRLTGRPRPHAVELTVITADAFELLL